MKTIAEIRQKFLDFYRERGHTVLPSASLVPENDPTTLFTGSGMQPLVPYLLGEKHPQGKRLTNSQKSFRSVDIDDVGDNRHTTFFEMLGNWSLGDYFKREQIPWVFEFLTEHVGLDPRRIYVTVFAGDFEGENASKIPRDDESAELWKIEFEKKGIVGDEFARHLSFYDVRKNWWSRSGVPDAMPAGEPGGPDTEIFYEFVQVEHDPKFNDPKYGNKCHPNCDCGRFLEIGNSVFMEYKKNSDGTFSKLSQQNVDFGGGLERIAMAANDTPDIFKIDVFESLIKKLEAMSGKKYSDTLYTAAFRVVADHIRSSVFLIGDGVVPSNTERGYFVRRLIRRAVRYWDKLGIDPNSASIADVTDVFFDIYKKVYPETYERRNQIKAEIKAEEEKFRATLRHGLKEFEKIAEKKRAEKSATENATQTSQISGTEAFSLFSSYGFPIDITKELATEKGLTVDIAGFEAEMKKHQDLSRTGSEKKFKGGLADTSDMSLRYHTATHLLNAALRKVLGDHVMQKGSNITPERLRFDFSHTTKMTDEEKKKVEDFVNSAIEAALPVSFKEMPKTEAEKLGAIHAFGEKYGDIVKVYTVGDESGTSGSSGTSGADASGSSGVISREFCGGPHVTNTRELAGPSGTMRFKIQKEEAVSAGVRRIKAVLQ